MISSRRAALLGIGFPLSPVMIAVLGLWPDEDEPTPPIFGRPIPPGGGDGRPRHSPARKLRRTDRRELDEEQARIRKQNDLILSLIMAAATEEMA